jgi:hypothetical protein
MIKLFCQGGLGNQLFIWSVAHILVKKYGEPVQISYSISNQTNRHVELEPLKSNCKHKISIKNERYLGKYLSLVDVIAFRFPLLKNRIFEFLSIDDYANPYENVKILRKPPRIVRGYFQNNDMVDEAIPDVHSEIKMYRDQLVSSRECSNLGAIHLRRGDYLLAAGTHGILTFEYYKRLLGDNQRYLLFIDDHSELTCNDSDIRILDVIDSKKASPWETLAMMSLSAEVIMANSSLSWWAGKLASMEGFLVYMPFPWNKEGHLYQRNLMCAKFTIVTSDFREV